MKRCNNCQSEIKQSQAVAIEQTCPKCNQPLHCCFNCHFYAPGAKFECLKPVEIPQKSKKEDNQCNFFKFREFEEQKREGVQVTAKKQFDDLFGNL